MMRAISRSTAAFCLAIIMFGVVFVDSTSLDPSELSGAAKAERSGAIVVNPGWGLMHYPWGNPTVESLHYVSGRAGGPVWRDLEPSEGNFNWSALEKWLANLPPGRKAWLRVDASMRANETLTPEWVFQAGARWVPHVVNSAVKVPVYWDPVFKAKWEATIAALAARYDGDPRLAGVEVNGQGHYGEMVPEWERVFNGDQKTWIDMGYNYELWIEHQKWSIDMFMRYFKKVPVAVQVVNDRALWGASPSRPVLDYAIQTYGMRVYPKWSGLGLNMRGMDKLLSSYSSATEIILEEAHPFKGYPEDYRRVVNNAIAARPSVVFLYAETLNLARSSEAMLAEFERLARFMGPQIMIVEAHLPEAVTAGGDFHLNLRWANRSDIPLRNTQRVGEKDLPASALAFIDLIREDGTTIIHKEYTPSLPTTEWRSGGVVDDRVTVSLPFAVPVGSYQVRVGIQNPRMEGPADRLKLLNEDANDGSNRYIIGQIQVRPGY